MRDYTPEQIAAMHDYNESFVGRTANMAKMQQHQDIKAGLIDFMELCDNVHKVEEIKPNRRRQCSLVYVDIRCPVMLDKDAVDTLARVMSKADSMAIAGNSESVRLSFNTEKVWTK